MKPIWILGAFAVSAAVIALCVVAVLAVTSANDRAMSAQSQARAAALQQRQTNHILERTCRDSGNPARAAVRGLYRHQIKQSKAFDYSKFFPEVPPNQLRRLIAKENKHNRRQIRKVAPVDCASLYH